MDPRNFTHLYTYRNKFYSLTAAVSLAACTCALGLPSTAFAANQTPAASAPAQAPAPASASAPVVTTPHAPAPASPETPAQPQDDSLTWTRDDFNITPDGKQIGYRKDITVPAHDGKPASTENVIVPGLNEKGLAKLKKNHHIVIPEGIEVIHECAFTGRAKQVGNKQHKHIAVSYTHLTLPTTERV